MRAAPPDLPGAPTDDSPIDRALTLLLAGEVEAALRWSAAVVERDGSIPSALVITCRLLSQMGRTEAAVDGFRLAVLRATDAGNLPLAIAALGDLRSLGVNVADPLDQVASAFCARSPRVELIANPPPPVPDFSDFEPLSSLLTGPALSSKATQILHAAARQFEARPNAAPKTAPLPLFGALSKEALRDLILTFEMRTVPAEYEVIEQGDQGTDAFIVARGTLEVRRLAVDVDAPPVVLAGLRSGALFGEMALLSRAPRAASVVTTRPSILLVASREALEAVSESHPEVGRELADHCRRRMVENLVRTSPVLVSVPVEDRARLVERFQTRLFEKGDRLVIAGDEPRGLHIIVSGEVAVVARDSLDSTVLATIPAGDTVGEVALVLRRPANADVIALHPTVTLFLAREDFLSLVTMFPAILHSLYMTAVRRDDETTVALRSSLAPLGDDYVLV
jgi:cAMP-dependent protein kinase regulator